MLNVCITAKGHFQKCKNMNMLILCHMQQHFARTAGSDVCLLVTDLALQRLTWWSYAYITQISAQKYNYKLMLQEIWISLLSVYAVKI